MGLDNVVLTALLGKLILTVVEMQKTPDIELTDLKKISYLKWTAYNGSRKVSVNFKTDRDK